MTYELLILLLLVALIFVSCNKTPGLQGGQALGRSLQHYHRHALLDPKHICLGCHEKCTTTLHEHLSSFGLSMTRSNAIADPTSFSVWPSNGRVTVLDQGPWGSCTAYSMRYAYLIYLNRMNPTAPLVEPSVAFWYAQSRLGLNLRPLYDSGSTITATVNVLSQYGAPTNAQWPYTSTNVFAVPPTSFSNPSLTKITVPMRIPNLSGTTGTNWQAQSAAIQASIASGRSVMLAIYVYANFMTKNVFISGVVPMPSGSLLGGHAITLVGYNSVTKVFQFYNSWGTYTGQNGLFTIPYQYVGNGKYAGEWWQF